MDVVYAIQYSDRLAATAAALCTPVEIVTC